MVRNLPIFYIVKNGKEFDQIVHHQTIPDYTSSSKQLTRYDIMPKQPKNRPIYGFQGADGCKVIRVCGRDFGKKLGRICYQI